MLRPKKSVKEDPKQPSIFSSLGKRLFPGKKEPKTEEQTVEDDKESLNHANSPKGSKRTSSVASSKTDSSLVRKSKKPRTNSSSNQSNDLPVADDSTPRTRPRRRAVTQRKPIVDSKAIDLEDDDDEFVLSNLEEDSDDFVLSHAEEESDEEDDGDASEIEADDYAPTKAKTRKGKPTPQKLSKTSRSTKEKNLPRARKPKIENEEAIQKHHLSDDPYENSLLNHVQNPFYLYNELNNSNSRKVANNLKDKMFHLFGFNQRRLIDMLKLQEDLNYNILHLSLKQMIGNPLNDITTKFSFTDSEIAKLTYEEFDSKFPMRSDLKIQFNTEKDTHTLIPGAVTYFPTITSNNPRQGFILNVGALPVDMAWNLQTNKANEANPNVQFLAISISDTFNVTDSRFSIYHSGKVFKGVNALQIYQIDTLSFEMRLVRSYISEFGVLSNLKWVPMNNDEPDVIGILGAVFSDGKIRFIKVFAKDSVGFCSLITASETVELPDTRITSFDFISNESIVFGTQNGFIGEYDLKDRSVSYLYPLLTNGVTSVTSNFSDFYHDKDPIFEQGEYKLKTKIVFVGSTDLQLFVDLNDIVNQTVESIKSKTLISQCCYLPLMHSFAVNDGSRITKVFSKRDSMLAINILKNEGVSSSIATSRLHPMVMGGSSDGEIFVADSLRRITATRKSALNQNFPTARVLKLEYSSKDDCYRLVTTHIVENVGLKEVDINFTFNAPDVCINSIVWNENIRSGNWYAASSMGGLIIIEKLPSFTTVKNYNGEEENLV